MVLFMLLTSFAVVVATFLWMYSSMKRPKGYPPGPRKWPLVGNLPWQLMSKSFVTRWTEWSEEYGNIYSIKSGELDLVVITDYELARKANLMEELADRPRYEFFQFFMKYMNAGILFANGENWKTQRRFTLRNLRDFGFGKSSIEDLVLKELEELACVLHPEHLGSKPNVIELDAALNATVTNVIWWLMANKRVSKEDPDFLKLLDTISSIIAFDATQLFSFFPSLFYKVPKRLLGLKNKEKMREHFYAYMKDVMSEHKKTLDPNSPRDLVDCYLIERQSLLDAGQDASVFTDERVAWTLCDLFIAGSETTSTSLRWFFLFMIHNLDIQWKIQEEIDQVIGRDSLPLYGDRPKMPYTEAAIWELLRMKPALPFGLERRATADITLGGYFIPKGTQVTTVIHAIHRDPKNFRDPHVYNPERFLDENGALVKNPKIMPFQAGKRQCLGEALARMTLFLGVTYLLQRFNFEKVPGETYTFESKVRTEAISLPHKYKITVIPRK